jgi:hypothetical protein
VGAAVPPDEKVGDGRSETVGTTAVCLGQAGMGDQACLPWAMAIWPVGHGPLKLGGLY